MPIIEINLFEGRTVEQKQSLIAAVTKAVTTTLDVPGPNVRIMIRELTKDNFGIDGKTARAIGR